jgi:hypothetical protein
MAEQRFHMNNGLLMVEHTDKKALEAIRKTDPRFKRKRIRQVLQCYPSQIKLGVVYPLT